MYTLTVDDNNLYIPEERSYSLNSAKIKINSDRVAYLDFEIPVTNKAYGLLNEKTSTVKVYKDNVLTYKFFIDSIEDDFYYNRSVSCTSVVEYLSDSIVRPYSTIESEPGLLAPSSLDGYFQWLIDQHNAVCDTKKKFYVGVNQGASLDNNNYVYRASTQTPTVSSEIKDKILTPYPSAYITVSFDGEKNIINLYSDIYDKNDQLIDFGVNLLDFVKTADYSKCYTAVRPTGSTPESSEGNSSKLPITIESIPDGVSKWSSDVYKKQDVVYSISGVNKWGYKECAYSNSDIKTVDSLYQASVVYLNKISSPALTIEVKAIDLSLLIGDKYTPLKVRQAVRIRSTPHNVDTYLTVSHIDIDVLDPTNDLYTLGESYDSLTGQQSAYVTRLNASINSAVDVIGSASDAASKLAEAASKKAQEAKEKADAATDAAAGATSKADTAVNKAENAVTKADTAISTATDTKAKVTLVEKKATEAKTAADTAKKAADDAATAADSAQSSAAKANEAASNANTAASKAQSTADSALSSAAQANKDVGNVKTQITDINKEMTSVKQDAANLRDDLTGQITTVKETMEADYTKKSELSATESNLKTEISKSAAGLRTEVSQTYSTKKELETTTKAAQTAQSTANAAKKAAESNASDLANAVSKFDGDITNLKDQIDGAIQTWFYDGIPNALTEPEVHWTTEKDRQTHLGDLYYDNKTGFCYRYMHQNGVYSWARIKDTEVTKALADAAKAQTTANAKKRIFITTPKPPYDIGDLWVQGSNGDIMRCQTPKIASQTYAEADWVKASKYTDDTAVKNLSNTVERTYATKSTVNQLSDRIEQTVSSVEEVRTDASAAKTTADNAQKAANDAAAAANTAHETATAAQTAASKAQEHATSAATAASTAKANADAAQAAANKANASLADAQKNLEDLQNRADVTDEELTAAKNAVASAQTAADSANSAASKAKELATTAQSTADTAKQNAATAQSKANAAASAASTAQSTADTAKANAKKAQDDVDAVKNRVTAAETSIKQNSDAITLRATKTEVTNAVNGISVGGRNIARNTSNEWSDWITPRPNSTNVTASSGSTIYFPLEINVGDEYYIQCEIEFDNVTSSDGKRSFFALQGSVDGKWEAHKFNPWNAYIYDVKNGVTRFGKKVTSNVKPTPTEVYAACDFRVDDWATGRYRWRRIKVEVGNKSTDWSPAPEDLVSESKTYTDAQLKVTSDSITSTVSKTYATKTDLSTTNSNVTKAQSTADTAKANAATAQSTADTAKANAATAQSTANTAKTNASTAQSTADTAKANAKKAQDDVNALKTRVASAETSITQNSDAIALRATKTEVNDALTSAKSYTDAQLKITSEGITSTVSKTYATKTDLSTTNSNVTRAQETADSATVVAANAQKTANDVKTDLATNYTTTTDMESKISQSAEGITSTVSKTYATKTELSATNSKVSKAQTAATAAGTAASAAQSTANTAKANAKTAQDTADSVKADLKANYTTTTDMESKISQSAEGITSTVSKTYATKTELSTTNSNVSKAQSTADSGVSKANAAQSTANTAKSTADSAVTKANAAQSTANSASTAASNAQSTADTANSTANTANSTANTVKNDLANNYSKKVLAAYSGIGNSDKYMHVATFTIKSGYINKGIRLSIQQRSCGVTDYYIVFTSTDSLDPTLSVFHHRGYREAYMCKISTSVWNFYINKTENWDQVAVVSLINSYSSSELSVTFPASSTTVKTLPSGYITSVGEIGGKLASDYSTTTEMNSSINQTAESIKSTVAATYVNNETLSSYATKSQLEQTSTSLTSRIQTTEKSVSGMSTTVKNVNDYMTFARENNQPTLTIGSSSSSFRTKLTNTSEKFMQGEQTIMELDGVTSTVKTSRVQLGHYQWRDTGTSMQLVYIP